MRSRAAASRKYTPRIVGRDVASKVWYERKREKACKSAKTHVGAERPRCRGLSVVPALYISQKPFRIFFTKQREEEEEGDEDKKEEEKKSEEARGHPELSSRVSLGSARGCRGVRFVGSRLHEHTAPDASRARHDVERVETIGSVPITFVQTGRRHAQHTRHRDRPRKGRRQTDTIDTGSRS